MHEKDSITRQRRHQLKDPDSPFRLVRLMGELAASLERVCPWEDIHFIFSRMVDDKKFVAHFLGEAMERFKIENWLDDLVEEEKKHYRKSKLFGKQEVKNMTEEGVFQKFRRVLQECGFFRVWQWEMLKLEPHVLPYTNVEDFFDYSDFLLVRANQIIGHVENARVGMPTDNFRMHPVSKDTFFSLSNTDERPGTVVLIDTRGKPKSMIRRGETFEDDEDYLGPILKKMREPEEEEEKHYRTRDSILMSRFDVDHEQWHNYVLKNMLSLKIFEGVKKIRYERVIETAVIQDLFTHMPRRYDLHNLGGIWCEEALLDEETKAYNNFVFGPVDEKMKVLNYFYGAVPDKGKTSDGKTNYVKEDIAIRPIIVLG